MEGYKKPMAMRNAREKTIPSQNPLNREATLSFVAALKKIITVMQECVQEIKDFMTQHPEFVSPEGIIQFAGKSVEEKNAILEPLLKVGRKFKLVSDPLQNDPKLSLGKAEGELFDESKRAAFQFLGIDECTFSHNLAHVKVITIFEQALAPLARYDHSTKPLNFDRALRAAHLMYFVPAHIEQTICHLVSIANSMERALGTYEADSQPASAKEVMKVVVGSRVLINQLNVTTADAPQLPDAISARIIETARDITVPIPHSEIVEILYPAISNAANIMDKERKTGVDSSTLTLEVVAREVEDNGNNFVVFEIFNSGEFIDITAIEKALSEFKPERVTRLPARIKLVVEAMQKGSRQAALSTLDTTEMLFLRGLTTKRTGNTGIGLADMQAHVNLRGGAVMINNVYNADPQKQGVCVTIICPASDGDTTYLKKITNRLKAAMKSGRYILPNTGEMAA